jgi:xanthine dehydrogenase small subunit
MEQKPGADSLKWLADQGFIPEYFIGIKERLQKLQQRANVQNENDEKESIRIAGGTDLVVQKALTVKKAEVEHLFDARHLQEIKTENGQCHIGATVTVTAFAESKIVQGIFPNLARYIKLISSTPIRNMATMAGNLVNASPIGDMSVFFLALNSDIVLNRNGNLRTIKLKDFYKGYKQIDKAADEIIEKIIFTVPNVNGFSFEKVSKRMHLDIASVNSACHMIRNKEGLIEEIHLSAGGVAPFPKYLEKTALFLKGKKPGAPILKEAISIINSEIAPISDARGTAAYKQLLLRQLFLAHFSKDEELVSQVLIK